MSGVLAMLRGWLEAGAALAARLPDLARLLHAASWPGALLAAASGVALLLFGARLGRVLAAVGAALIGWLAGGMGAGLVEGWLPSGLPPWIGAAVLGAAAAMAPEVYPIALGLLPGALLGSQVAPAGRPWLGSLALAAALAALGFLLRRLVMALTAALAGGILLAAALLTLSDRVPAVRVLAQRPAILAGLVGLLIVAGTAFQLGQRSGGARPRAAKAEKGVADA